LCAGSNSSSGIICTNQRNPPPVNTTARHRIRKAKRVLRPRGRRGRIPTSLASISEPVECIRTESPPES
jgi:hypothetical protein